MPHVDGLLNDDDASPDQAGRILRDKEAHPSVLMRDIGKPSNWWAFEREPWKRVGAEIRAAEQASANKERADRALRSAFAFAGLGLGLARVPSFVPGDRN
jgi:hypothetical protein